MILEQLLKKTAKLSVRATRYLVVLAFLALANAATADILYPQGNRPAMVGMIVKETDLEIVFREQFLSGATRERKLFKADVLKVVRTIDENRLAALRPEDPGPYFEYAEELAAYEADFVARQLALRLYLLAAKNGDAEIRKSSFLGMLDFGLDQGRQNRIRALAILTLPSKYHSLFSIVEKKSELDSKGREQLLEALRLMRTGKLEEAKVLIQENAVRLALAHYSDHLRWDELNAFSLEKELKLEQLSRIIRLELRIRDDSKSKSNSMPGSNWSSDAGRPARMDPRWVHFDNVTPFRSSLSIYRNGKWQEPEL